MRTSLRSQKMFLVIFKGICMKFSPIEKNISSQPVTSKQSPRIVQILRDHPEVHISVALIIPILENVYKMADYYFFQHI